MTKDSGVNGVIIPEMYCVFLLVAHPTWTKICREAGDGGGGVEEARVNMGKLSVFFFFFCFLVFACFPGFILGSSPVQRQDRAPYKGLCNKCAFLTNFL